MFSWADLPKWKNTMESQGANGKSGNEEERLKWEVEMLQAGMCQRDVKRQGAGGMPWDGGGRQSSSTEVFPARHPSASTGCTPCMQAVPLSLFPAWQCSQHLSVLSCVVWGHCLCQSPLLPVRFMWKGLKNKTSSKGRRITVNIQLSWQLSAQIPSQMRSLSYLA